MMLEDNQSRLRLQQKQRDLCHEEETYDDDDDDIGALFSMINDNYRAALMIKLQGCQFFVLSKQEKVLLQMRNKCTDRP